MGKAKRVLVIGLDSMDQGMARKWAAEGVLPHIAKLLETSAWGEVKTPPGLVAGAVWPTFYTGNWPSRHGLYYFWRQAYPGSYDLRQIEDDDFSGPTIWEALSDAGKRVAVFDPPYTFLARDLNGIQIRDWGTHAPMTCSEHRFEKDRFQAYPAEMVDEINQRFGPDKVGMCDHIPLHTAKDFSDWRDGLVERVKTRTDMSLRYLRQEPWDLFMSVYSECHCIGHHALQLHDPEHALYNPDFAAQLGDPVRDVYVATDKAIGRLLEAAGEDTVSLVLFSHGIEANYTGSDLLDKVLERIDGVSPGAAHSTAHGVRKLWWRLPERVRAGLEPVKDTVWPTLKAGIGQPKRASRRFYEVPTNDLAAGIRINLVGREPDGLVHEGAEYDEVCAELTEKLTALVDPETGEPVVEKVLRTDKIYSGGRVRDLPDLLVQWHRRKPFRSVSSPEVGEVSFPIPPKRTGDHTASSLFCASGAQVRPGKLNHMVGVIDFAPTIARLLGVEMEDVDGDVIDAIAGNKRRTKAA